MQFEFSQPIAATPAKIFALYADVAQWHRWDPDLKSASINGAFSSGTTGEVVPKSGPTSKVLFTDVRPNEGFAVECKLPLCLMRFEHRLRPTGDGTDVTHGVRFSGPLAWFFGRVIGRELRKGLPKALAGLQAAATA